MTGVCPWSWNMATTQSNSPPAARLIERVRGVGAGRVDALAAGVGDRRADRDLLLVAEEPALAGVGIQAAHGDARAGDPEVPHRPVAEPDRPRDALPRDQIGDAAERHVGRHVDHAELPTHQEHGVGLRAGELGQDLGVPRVADAGGGERLLVDGRGDDRRRSRLPARVARRARCTRRPRARRPRSPGRWRRPRGRRSRGRAPRSGPARRWPRSTRASGPHRLSHVGDPGGRGHHARVADDERARLLAHLRARPAPSPRSRARSRRGLPS